MEKEKYLEDLSEIRSIMDRSSKFVSLSGLSGVMAGIYALIGAYAANQVLHLDGFRRFGIKFDYSTEVVQLLLIAVTVLVFAIGTAAVLSYRKAKAQNASLWDATARRLLWNLMIPLATGGILVILLISYKEYYLVAPLTLIFYGLALINASKYTLGDVQYLGLFEVVIGLVSVAIPGYGLYFWALGFGIMHIVYGFVMYIKYDRG